MKTLITALAAAFVYLCASPADAQQGAFCLPVKDAIRAANERFKEVPAFIMVSGNGAVMTLTVAKDGNWTLWIQADAEKMCVIVTGEGFAPASDAIKALAVPGKDT